VPAAAAAAAAAAAVVDGALDVDMSVTDDDDDDAGDVAGATDAQSVSIFRDMEAVAHGDLDAAEQAFVKRYFVAFDGDVAKEVSALTTHVFAATLDDALRAQVAQHSHVLVVSPQWLRECVKQRALLPEAPFVVA
jgi:hypothetical protein